MLQPNYKEVFLRKSKIDATVAFPHLSGLSKEEAKREYEKLIGVKSDQQCLEYSKFYVSSAKFCSTPLPKSDDFSFLFKVNLGRCKK